MRLYFAYGSNLKCARMQDRVPGTTPAGIARLPEHAMRLDKRGRDGSGKANLIGAEGQSVWGVLYELPPGGFDQLDRFEGGYQRVRVRVVVAASTRTEAADTYVSDRRISEPVALDWYHALLLEGAREQGLPASWIAHLEALPTRPSGGVAPGSGA